MKPVGYYYKMATIPPLLTVVIAAILLIASHDGSAYKSEWSADDGFIETVLLSGFLSLIIILLSCSIYLNRYAPIRKNLLWSGLAWFLLPGIVCVWLIYEELVNFGNSTRAHYEGNRLLDGFVLGIGLVHVVFLGVGFWRFRRRNVEM